MKKPTRTLFIGDAHAKPGVSNRRFTWLGRFIADRRPDLIIDIGDFEDMESLCSYDRGKAKFEGRRYKKDIACAIEARALVNAPVDAMNAKLSRAAQYRPRKVALGGNHAEARMSRAMQDNAELEGLISLEDLQHKKYGWEYVPFLEAFSFGGALANHYFVKGVMGKPVGGECPAYALIRTQYTTCFQGHSHLFDYAHRTRPDGKRIHAFHIGAYLDLPHVQHEDYAGPANAMWARGLLEVENLRDGDFDSFTWHDIRKIKREYGT